MPILWTLFEIGINLFEACLYCYFLHKRLSLRPNLTRQQRVGADLAVILAVTAFYSLYIWFDVPVTDSIVWLFTLGYSMIVFSEKWYIKVVWNACLAALMLGIVSACSSLALFMTQLSWERLMEPSLRRVVFVLTSNIIALIVLYIVAQIKLRQSGMTRIALSVYALLNVALILGVEMLYNLSWLPGIPDRIIFTATFAQFFAAICALVLFDLLSHRTEAQMRMEAQMETARITETHYQEMRMLYARLAEYQHDLKHQHALLKEMISKGQARQAQDYLEQLHKNTLPVQYTTGNLAVDALLSVKGLSIQQAGVHFAYESCPLAEFPMEETAFCAMLGNLLDNAVEAVQRLPRGNWEIGLKIVRIRDMLCITCVNDANEDSVIRKGSAFLSSKREGKSGYGVESIRRTVQQADGIFTFKCVGGKAIVEITVPFSAS